jgi:hypothetical protein
MCIHGNYRETIKELITQLFAREELVTVWVRLGNIGTLTDGGNAMGMKEVYILRFGSDALSHLSLFIFYL